jgi:gamma-glutamyltranspeptidase/glutathione hydrolase
MLAEHGKDGFYKGRIAQSIVDIVNDNGGRLTLDDLENHSSTLCDPISTTYEGIRVWEIPPNGQGIIVLLALNILKNFSLKGRERSNGNSNQNLNQLKVDKSLTEASHLHAWFLCLWLCAIFEQ